ncbi:unnamed protein product [Penicillium salamii]|nr:unnamed protein product [Penicillium salamii]CAG8343569.1 unnamed protein product [Penicillium salamii]
MDVGAVNVEGYGHNIGRDDCSMDFLPEMNRVYWQHFQLSQDKLCSILQQSQSHLRALVGRESFAGFLNVSLMSDMLAKKTEVIFEAPRPCVLQPENGEAAVDISWLDVAKEKNYQAEHKGNGIYHFHMPDRDVIVQLSTFQHNMILSGLPRKLVQPWSYEKDVQMGLYSLALAAEMTSLINQTASEVIKANNTVLEEIGKRDHVLRHSPQPGQRSATTPFSERDTVSVELPANSSPAGADADSLDEVDMETRSPGAQGNTKRRGAARRRFSKNNLWSPHVLKQLPEWFEDQVRRNLSQEDIARNFQQEFKQKRTFNALEAMLYKLTGKSPYRKRGKQPTVSSTPRASSPPHQSSGSLVLPQQMILRSNTDVHTLHLAPSIVPYLTPKDSEDDNPFVHPGAQPIDSDSESNGSNAVHGYDLANEESACLGASRGHRLQPGQCLEIEEPYKDLPNFSDSAVESLSQSDHSNAGDSINLIEADWRNDDFNAPRDSPSEARRIIEPVRPRTEDDMTPAGSVQTLLHPNQDCLSHGNPPAKNAGHCSARQAPLAGASANESTGHVPGDSLARATAPSLVSQPSPIGSSTEDHSLNYRMNGPSTDTIEGGLAEEGMVRSCVVKRPQAHVRPHRPWKDEDLNRLPRWFMARKHLPKNILEVEFLEDFKHHRTPSAISAACRKRMKAEARLKNATSRCTPISPPRAIPVAFESTQISQTPSTIAGHNTPGLNSPHIPSKEMSAPGNPSLERPRSRRTRLQIPESRGRSSFAHSSFTCGDEDADGTTSSASVGSTCAPAQSAVSQPIRDADESPGSGNQKDVPPGRFGEVNDGKDQRTRPNMESAAPRAQVEREGLRAPHGGQRNWPKSTPPERLVWQELNGQNELQISSPQILAERQTYSHDPELPNGTLEATGGQPHIYAVVSDARAEQVEARPNLQNTSQVQAKPDNITFQSTPQPNYSATPIQIVCLPSEFHPLEHHSSPRHSTNLMDHNLAVLLG